MAVSMLFFFFLLAFVALSDGSLYLSASHLKHITVGETVGY